MRKYYNVYGVVDPDRYNQFFNAADIVISRAGANSVSKIIASKKLSILIPLPISHLSEQQENANLAQSLGLARIINQENLTPSRLLYALADIVMNHKKLLKNVEKIESPDNEAAEKLVKLINEYI
jgi:UDP-N-acetylglucosamine--N-acetylmuramyl-(pentapeptide) pyrophosphoryl-undecaprenol N-acetylglucosamine transferase